MDLQKYKEEKATLKPALLGIFCALLTLAFVVGILVTRKDGVLVFSNDDSVTSNANPEDTVLLRTLPASQNHNSNTSGEYTIKLYDYSVDNQSYLENSGKYHVVNDQLIFQPTFNRDKIDGALEALFEKSGTENFPADHDPKPTTYFTFEFLEFFGYGNSYLQNSLYGDGLNPADDTSPERTENCKNVANEKDSYFKNLRLTNEALEQTDIDGEFIIRDSFFSDITQNLQDLIFACEESEESAQFLIDTFLQNDTPRVVVKYKTLAEGSEVNFYVDNETGVKRIFDLELRPSNISTLYDPKASLDSFSRPENIYAMYYDNCGKAPIVEEGSPFYYSIFADTEYPYPNSNNTYVCNTRFVNPSASNNFRTITLKYPEVEAFEIDQEATELFETQGDISALLEKHHRQNGSYPASLEAIDLENGLSTTSNEIYNAVANSSGVSFTYTPSPTGCVECTSFELALQLDDDTFAFISYYPISPESSQ